MDLTRIGWTKALYSPDMGGMETRQADGSGETTPDSWPSAAVEPLRTWSWGTMASMQQGGRKCWILGSRIRGTTHLARDKFG